VLQRCSVTALFWPCGKYQTTVRAVQQQQQLQQQQDSGACVTSLFFWRCGTYHTTVRAVQQQEQQQQGSGASVTALFCDSTVLLALW
jgi:hypothetical protein